MAKYLSAVLVSDLHLWHTPPLARSGEQDWYGCMERQLKELWNLSEGGNIPLVIAGDIFNNWQAKPEIISLALKWLHGYAVPGNHDLPYHSMKEVKKSAFWSLVEGGKITMLRPGKPVEIGGIALHGFPFSCPVKPLRKPHDLLLEVAVVHDFIWQRNTGYSPKGKHIKDYGDRLKGYGVALFGDNHTYVSAGTDGCLIFNPGSFMVRTTDQVGVHKPCVGLLYSDGVVERHLLDCSKDVYTKTPTDRENGQGLDLSRFLEELGELKDLAISFSEAVNRVLDREQPPLGVRKETLQAMEEQR